MAKIELISNLLHDGTEYEAGKRIVIDDDVAKAIIEAGGARSYDDSEPVQSIQPTQSTLAGDGGPVGAQAPTPQITPASAPTQEQIQSELDQAGLGNGDQES